MRAGVADCQCDGRDLRAMRASYQALGPHISIHMKSIANSRAEKATQRPLDENEQAAQAKGRRAQLDRVLAAIWKRRRRPQSEAERARLADHRDLYGPDGLPR
jgi:hypothetical protein